METGICPECKNPIQPGWTYCDNCGKRLSPAPATAELQPLDKVNTPAYIPTPQLAPYSAVEQPVVNLSAGRLVIQSNNIFIPIPQDIPEATLGRQDAASNSYPEIDLDPYGGHAAGVGRQHARLTMAGGQLCLVDLNSVNGSYINRKKISPEQPVPIQDGDEIRLGRLKMIYYAG